MQSADQSVPSASPIPLHKYLVILRYQAKAGEKPRLHQARRTGTNDPQDKNKDLHEVGDEEGNLPNTT